jgi:hypothetical protein
MKTRSVATVLGLCTLLASFALSARGQDKPKEQAMPDAKAMEDAMMKAAAPGPNHQRLSRLVGDWTCTTKMWMAPGQPPMESGCTMHAESILGGRYVQSVYKGSFAGMPFEGHGTDGYDNVTKRYVSSWVDNMGTGIMNGTGTCDDAGKVCTMMAEMADPMSGQMVKQKMVTTYTDGAFKMEMFMIPPGAGGEMKTMELTATKKK